MTVASPDPPVAWNPSADGVSAVSVAELASSASPGTTSRASMASGTASTAPAGTTAVAASASAANELVPILLSMTNSLSFEVARPQETVSADGPLLRPALSSTHGDPPGSRDHAVGSTHPRAGSDPAHNMWLVNPGPRRRNDVGWVGCWRSWTWRGGQRWRRGG